MKKKNIVKSSQGKVYILIVAILVIGWLVSIALLTDNTAVDEQLRLFNDAKAYMEDGIYIRAANSLKEALTYETEYNPKIENKLLEVYKEGGFDEDYTDLAKKAHEEAEEALKDYRQYGAHSDPASVEKERKTLEKFRQW